jgi:branched-chain amino acid transport system ATP-binding protein
LPESILSLENSTIRFGGLVAVCDLDLNIGPNDLVGLIGPNGAGKTTVFNIITGVYKPTSGKIIFDGKDIVGKKPFQIAGLGIGRTF